MEVTESELAAEGDAAEGGATQEKVAADGDATEAPAEGNAADGAAQSAAPSVATKAADVVRRGRRGSRTESFSKEVAAMAAAALEEEATLAAEEEKLAAAEDGAQDWETFELEEEMEELDEKRTLAKHRSVGMMSAFGAANEPEEDFDVGEARGAVWLAL